MRVDLTKDVFQEAEALTDLLILLRSFIEGPHDWVADAETIVAAGLYLREHAPNLADTYLELARKGTVAATWNTATGSSVVVRVAAAALTDYASDLSRPAVLIVEDQDADGCFIRVVARVLGADKLGGALAKGWLQIEHGGGSSVERVAETAAGRFRRCVRVAALMDSDRLVPGQTTAAHDKASRLAGKGVAVHVLELREAENYVPDRVLSRAGAAREASRKLDLLGQLTPSQRGYLDMKHGFGRPDRPPQVLRDQRILFKNLDRSVLLGLRGGFGRDLLTIMEDTCGTLAERDFSSLGAGVIAELLAMLAKITNVI